MGTTRLIFSGSGGQGVITAAIILAEAAVIYEGKNATQTQDYGAAARGGSTRSDIIIADDTINYPGVVQPNILVTLTQEAYVNFSTIVRPGGLLLSDPRFVETTKNVDAKKLELPMYELIMEKIGKPIVYNICILGTLIGITKLIGPESIIQVLNRRIPSEFLDINQRALDIGLALGTQYQCKI